MDVVRLVLRWGVVWKPAAEHALLHSRCPLPAPQVGKSGGSGAALWLLAQPAAAILASVALGGTAGYLLQAAMQARPSSLISLGSGVSHPPGAAAAHPGGAVARLLRGAGAARLRPVLPLLISATTFALADELGAEPLLSCVAAGLVASNWR